MFDYVEIYENGFAITNARVRSGLTDAELVGAAIERYVDFFLDTMDCSREAKNVFSQETATRLRACEYKIVRGLTSAEANVLTRAFRAQ